MNWFLGTGVAGWLIVGLGAALLAAGVVAAAVRVARTTAILLVAASALPVLVGVAGMVAGRSSTRAYMASHPEATAEDRATGEDESMRSLWLGIGAMLVCDAAAVAALLRSRPPAPPAGG